MYIPYIYTIYIYTIYLPYICHIHIYHICTLLNLVMWSSDSGICERGLMLLINKLKYIQNSKRSLQVMFLLVAKIDNFVSHLIPYRNGEVTMFLA